MTNDAKTTAAGIVGAAGIILGLFNIDINMDIFDLVRQILPSMKDGLPLSKLIFALAFGVGMYFTNKKNKPA